MKTLVAVSTISLLALLTGFLTGIEPFIERLYYGPDKADCIRIEGCNTSDAVVWFHHETSTQWVCVDNEWIAYDPADTYSDEDITPKTEDF